MEVNAQKPRRAGIPGDLLGSRVNVKGTSEADLVPSLRVGGSQFSDAARRTMAVRWTELIWGDREGYAAMGLGVRPTLVAGKYRYSYFKQSYFRWPGDQDELLELGLAEAADSDVFVCPLLRDRPSRRGSGSAPLPSCWAWIDADPWSQQQQRRLDAFETDVVTVLSGGKPDNRHLYVHLGREYEGEEVTAVAARLAKTFETDTHGGNNKYLRLPGTLNYKPAAAGGEPSPVVMLPC